MGGDHPSFLSSAARDPLETTTRLERTASADRDQDAWLVHDHGPSAQATATMKSARRTGFGPVQSAAIPCVQGRAGPSSRTVNRALSRRANSRGLHRLRWAKRLYLQDAPNLPTNGASLTRNAFAVARTCRLWGCSQTKQGERRMLSRKRNSLVRECDVARDKPSGLSQPHSLRHA